MKISIILFSLLFIAGCSGLPNKPEIDNNNKLIIQGIAQWKIVYDSTSGYNKNYGTMVENEIAFTPYKDVNSVPYRPSPEYLFSDMRGRNLSININQMLKTKGINVSDNANGVINVSRPVFWNDGRYILRATITFMDNNKEIASIDVINNLRKETTANGIVYKDTGNLMDDTRFSSACAEKILEIMGKNNK